MHYAHEVKCILSRNQTLKFSETIFTTDKLSEILQRDDFHSVKK